jgi:hypothetical protein
LSQDDRHSAREFHEGDKQAESFASSLDRLRQPNAHRLSDSYRHWHQLYADKASDSIVQLHQFIINPTWVGGGDSLSLRLNAAKGHYLHRWRLLTPCTK